MTFTGSGRKVYRIPSGNQDSRVLPRLVGQNPRVHAPFSRFPDLLYYPAAGRGSPRDREARPLRVDTRVHRP